MREQRKHPARLCIMAAAVCCLVSSTMAETRICLNMIAKDEGSEILLGLQPVAPELSGWTLCDTGKPSTAMCASKLTRTSKSHGQPTQSTIVNSINS